MWHGGEQKVQTLEQALGLVARSCDAQQVVHQLGRSEHGQLESRYRIALAHVREDRRARVDELILARRRERSDRRWNVERRQSHYLVGKGAQLCEPAVRARPDLVDCCVVESRRQHLTGFRPRDR